MNTEGEEETVMDTGARQDWSTSQYHVFIRSTLRHQSWQCWVMGALTAWLGVYLLFSG